MSYRTFNQKIFLKWFLRALILAFLSGIIIPQPVISYKIINGLFFSGTIIFGIGAMGFASYLGGFDLFKYTHRKLSQYSAKNLKNPVHQSIGTYYDYIADKKSNKYYLFPLSVGGIYISASFLFTFIV